MAWGRVPKEPNSFIWILKLPSSSSKAISLTKTFIRSLAFCEHWSPTQWHFLQNVDMKLHLSKENDTYIIKEWSVKQSCSRFESKANSCMSQRSIYFLKTCSTGILKIMFYRYVLKSLRKQGKTKMTEKRMFKCSFAISTIPNSPQTLSQ